MIYYSISFVKWGKEKKHMDPATLARHALEALKRPLTLKEALSSVADFRIDRRKKFPLYEILMIAVCAMIDGAKGPTFGVASLRSVSAASVQQFSVQWEADGSPLPTGRWLLAAGCWNTVPSYDRLSLS